MIGRIADGGITVVDSAHYVSSCRWPEGDPRTPGIIGICGHAGGVKKNSYRISIETVLDKNIVVRRDEKVVTSGNSADPEFEPIEAGKNIPNVKMMTISPGTVTGHASASGAGVADVEFLNRETRAFLDAVTEDGKKLN